MQNKQIQIHPTFCELFRLVRDHPRFSKVLNEDVHTTLFIMVTQMFRCSEPAQLSLCFAIPRPTMAAMAAMPGC